MLTQSPVVTSSTFFADKLPFHMNSYDVCQVLLPLHPRKPFNITLVRVYLLSLWAYAGGKYLILNFLIFFYFWFPARLLYLCIHAVEKYFTIALTFEFIWIFEYLSTCFLFELMQVENISFSLYCYFWKSRIFIHFLSFSTNASLLLSLLKIDFFWNFEFSSTCYLFEQMQVEKSQYFAFALSLEFNR